LLRLSNYALDVWTRPASAAKFDTPSSMLLCSHLKPGSDTRMGKSIQINDRTMTRALIIVALGGLVIGLAAMIAGRAELARWAWIAATTPVIAALAFAIIRDLRAGRMGVDVLALLSMAGALALDQTLAGAIVAVMYAGGQALEDFAVGRAERDLKALIDRAPRLAHRKRGDALEDVPIDQIDVGNIVLVRAGEVVPIDGHVASPSALIDESMLTGEPMPVARQAGQAVSSGTINAGDTFEIRAVATAGDSAYAGIVRMVTAAQTAKAPFIRMADRYALLLLPVTLCIAGAAWWLSGDAVRALAVLVAATPCPLILAAPAAFIGGASQAARRGVLVKGSGPLEALARIHTVMFDKTGTLTVGGARLVAVETAPGVAPDEALRLAASIEQASHHVLGATIVSTARGKGLSLETPGDVREVLGSGLEGVLEGRKIGVGSLEFVHGEGRLEEWARRAARRASWRSALTVFVAVDGRVIAVLLFADELRRETPRAIQALRRAGVSRIVMVTGDRSEPAETIGAALDLDAVLAERVPSDKVDAVATERRRASTLMVGDGINDAPALAAANVGLAMGARGASASSEAADAVILIDRLDRVAEAVAIARRTRGIAMQSIVAGMALSGVTMIAAAFGYVTPVAGALLQEAIDVAVILNALRALAPPNALGRPPMSEAAAAILREEHEKLAPSLERLRQIADALDDAKAAEAVDYVLEANRIIETVVARHERQDEATIYPRVLRYLKNGHALSAMSRAHREILHQARLLGRLSEGLRPSDAEPYLVRDAQRIIESIESLVHIHNAQEEDIYEDAAAQLDLESQASNDERLNTQEKLGATAFERALDRASDGRRRWRMLAGALVVLAFAAGGAYWGWRHYSRLQGGAPAPESAWSETMTARIASDSMPIGAVVSGVIDAVSCDVGSIVKAGQVCAQIDARPYRLIVERGEASLSLANENLEKARRQLARAHAIHERNQSLSKRRAIARSTLQISQKAVERASAELADAEASAASAKAALALAKSNLERTSIVSPIAGTVVVRNVTVGETVVAGRTEPLFRVAADPRMMKIAVTVGSRLADALRVGDAVSVSLETDPDRPFAGRVTQISVSREPSGGGAATYDVVIATDEAAARLKPDTTTRIRILPAPRATKDVVSSSRAR
jgi:heavy metal translocating P-type ATPase/RND family efflux transporter MFP subunit